MSAFRSGSTRKRLRPANHRSVVRVGMPAVPVRSEVQLVVGAEEGKSLTTALEIAT